MFTGSSPAETNNEVMPRYPTRCHKSWECPLSCHRSELLVYLSLGSKNHLKQKHHLDTIEKKFLGILFLFMNFGGLLCFPIKKKTNQPLSLYQRGPNVVFQRIIQPKATSSDSKGCKSQRSKRTWATACTSDPSDRPYHPAVAGPP